MLVAPLRAFTLSPSYGFNIDRIPVFTWGVLQFDRNDCNDNKDNDA
jgi:hypothetical protein